MVAGSGGSPTATSGTPTISRALDQFLADEERRLSPRTFGNYRNVVDLLRHYLNGYGDATPRGQTGGVPRAASVEFCDAYGPDEIAPNLPMFFSDFMVRKVAAGQDLMRAAGTVTKRLAGWLSERGYIDAPVGERLAAAGSRAANVLPKVEALRRALHEHTENLAVDADDEQIEDHFTIEQVSPRSLTLRAMIDGREIRVELPPEITRRSQVGWSISGVAGRAGRRWYLVDAWNVYPH